MSNGSDYAVPGGYDPYYDSPSSDYSVPGGYDPFTNTTPTNSQGGWLNSVANLLPSIGKIVTDIYSAKRGIQPITQTTQPNARPAINGIIPQVKNPSGIGAQVPSGLRATSNILLYGVAGVLLLILLMKR